MPGRGVTVIYWFPGRKPAPENTSERQNGEKRKFLKKKKKKKNKKQV
jgi:hypothetical protein